MPFENANCYGYALGANFNLAPGSLGDEEIAFEGLDMEANATRLLAACKRDGLIELATGWPIAVFINKYDGSLDYHFYRLHEGKWSHKMGNVGAVETGIHDAVTHNARLRNTEDPAGDLIIDQHFCGFLYKSPELTEGKIIAHFD